MTKLTFLEKRKFEKLFDLGTGYVMDFSNTTFQEFIVDAIGIDIYEEKYNYGSGSKANRLRGFWTIETPFMIGLLLEKLLEYWNDKVKMGEFSTTESDQVLYEDCLKIVKKLKSNTPVENIDAIQANIDEKSFNFLAQSIKKSIEENEPESALDRLHTFTIKYVKQLCNKHQIIYEKDTPLHSLFGAYVKFLKNQKLIHAEMTEKILKSSISVLDAFNKVRNTQSFAHDNKLLNYNESILIFNNISNVIKFLEEIEKPETENKDIEQDLDISDDFPF